MLLIEIQPWEKVAHFFVVGFKGVLPQTKTNKNTARAPRVSDTHRLASRDAGNERRNDPGKNHPLWLPFKESPQKPAHSPKTRKLVVIRFQPTPPICSSVFRCLRGAGTAPRRSSRNPWPRAGPPPWPRSGNRARERYIDRGSSERR